MSRSYKRKNHNGNFNQNDGVPGVVYILRNEAFKENWLKIGCSRHSGHVRARDMNKEASTGLPAHHVCVFEYKTFDCGRSEKAVHSALSKYRKGRQEFFEVNIDIAKSAIQKICIEIDAAIEIALKGSAKAVQEERERRDAAENRANKEFLQEAAERRERIAGQERRQHVEEESRRHKERERTAAMPQVDMACPECGIVLSIPSSSAGHASQKFRCKNCLAVFLADGSTASKRQKSEDTAVEFTPQFAQKPASKLSTISFLPLARVRYDWLLTVSANFYGSELPMNRLGLLQVDICELGMSQPSSE